MFRSTVFGAFQGEEYCSFIFATIYGYEIKDFTVFENSNAVLKPGILKRQKQVLEDSV